MGWFKQNKYGTRILLGLIVVVLYFGLKGLPLRETAATFAEWVRSKGPIGILAFWAVYVVATMLFLPVSLLSLSAGAIFGPAKGLALALSGAISGASMAFLVARHAARQHVEKWTSADERFQAVDAAIGEEGWKIVFLLRLSILIPFHISNYVLGITRVSFLAYLLASAVGMAPGTFVYVYIGYLGKQTVLEKNGMHPSQWALVITGLTVTILITVYLGKLARRHLTTGAAAKSDDLTDKKGDPR